MSRSLACLSIFLLVLMCFPGSAVANGKDLFVSKCGVCHKSGGEAPVFAPTKFASGQWDKFFEKDKHGRKKDISGQVPAGEQTAIKDYLMKHAADSDQPEAVGLR